jgi:hypothetical protein
VVRVSDSVVGGSQRLGVLEEGRVGHILLEGRLSRKALIVVRL